MIKKVPHSLQFNLLPIEIQLQMRDSLRSVISSIPERNITETVSEWAERKRSIGSGLTANPGPFSFKLTPYLREIADNLSDSSPVLENYTIKPTQVGYTVGVMENHQGFCVEYGIGPLLYVGGDQAMAEEQFEKRIDEMIEQSGLQGKIRANIKKRKGKSTGDRADSKSYGGTWMRSIGPNSENKAASFPARIVHGDEADKWPVQLVKNGVNSGDILKKIIRRQDSYDKLKKTNVGSTPKNKSISRIEPLVEEGDKRHYNITCKNKNCKKQHPLLWSNFKWDKKEDGSPDLCFEEVGGVEVITKDPTYIECPFCGYKLRQKYKYEVLLEKGHGGYSEWIPTKKSIRPFVRSYVLNGLYGFRRWEDIMIEFLEVKDNPLLFPDFCTDVLGETWEDSKEKPKIHELQQLAQEFEKWKRGTIKQEVIFLTLTCDLQADRLEASLCGWGLNKQAWLIDYWTFEGETNTLEDNCYMELEDKIRSKYVREDGQEMHIQVAFIDSQYNTQTVLDFCDRFEYDENNIAGVYPIQAQETQDKYVKEFSKSDIKTSTIGIHDQKFKHTLYAMLRKRPAKHDQFPGHYFHFSEEYGEDFYKQLTAEEIISITAKGAIKGTKILNTKQRRNEVFDLCKYHLAAYQYMIDKYFEIINRKRKLQKQHELQQNTFLFMQSMQELLYQ